MTSEPKAAAVKVAIWECDSGGGLYYVVQDDNPHGADDLITDDRLEAEREAVRRAKVYGVPIHVYTLDADGPIVAEGGTA